MSPKHRAKYQLGYSLKFPSLLVCLIIAMTLASCASAPTPSSKLTVITTFYPLQYLAQRIGGDRVQVTNLVPPAIEPHDWEPTPADVVSIRKARVFVYHGAGLETWAERVVRDLPNNAPLTVNATQGLDLYPSVPEDGGENDDKGKSAPDPHVWLDPQLYARQAELVEAALSKADPTGASIYAINLANLKKDLGTLQSEMNRGLASCKRRTILTSHTAFAYLARRFRIQQLAVSGLSPDAEPSPARLREILQQMREQGATHIFSESLVSPAVSETIAREVGAKTLVLNPLEGLTKEEAQAGEDYFTIMAKNLANLRIALGCQ